MLGCRGGGQCLVLDVRHPTTGRPGASPLGPHVRRPQTSNNCQLTVSSSDNNTAPTIITAAVRRPSVSTAVVLGRRDLPSRGLPIKRCRLDAPFTDHAHRDDVADDVIDDDWNKENVRPTRDQRRRHVDFVDSSRRNLQELSPANHVYHTLEPRAAADTGY